MKKLMFLAVLASLVLSGTGCIIVPIRGHGGWHHGADRDDDRGWHDRDHHRDDR